MNVTPYSYSPQQDFMWAGDYVDGTAITEFDRHTGSKNSFYEIKRQDLLRFGLVGHGMKLFYEVYGGFYKIQGQMLELIYKVGDKEYYLTGQPQPYNDIITYKDAEATANLMATGGGRFQSRITQYNFGYKKSLEIDGVKFHVKTLVCIPFHQPAYLKVRIVADKNLKGHLVIKKNGLEAEVFEAELSANRAGELNWVIR